MTAAGYDFAAHCFKADSVFAAGTNADIVALWYPEASGDEAPDAWSTGFNAFTAEQGAAQSVALPGSTDAIASLHRFGFRLGVATNDSTSGAEKTLLALGVAQMFDAAYGYDAVANPKPAPDAIQAFCDLTGLKPSEIAMVGDNRHDLEMARAGGAGLAVGVLSRHRHARDAAAAGRRDPGFGRRSAGLSDGSGVNSPSWWMESQRLVPLGLRLRSHEFNAHD